MGIKFFVIFAAAASMALILSVFAQEECGEFCTHDIETSGTWDSCNPSKVGQIHKSVSKCYVYKANETATTWRCISRYDFYRCSKINGVIILYPGNCTAPPVPIYVFNNMTNTSALDIFNRFDNSTKTCRLEPPVFVPSTTTTMVPTSTSSSSSTSEQEPRSPPGGAVSIVKFLSGLFYN